MTDDKSGEEGGKRGDNPEPGEGTGEGDRGLGTQTDAAGGAESDVTRGNPQEGESAARHGGEPNPPEGEPAERDNKEE